MSRRWWDARAGLLARAPLPVASPVAASDPTQGYRVNFQRQPSGVLVVGDWQTLLRVSNREVSTWQVTLSPVFRQAVGPVEVGVPTAAGQTGAPFFRMTFGAGGVTFRYQGRYPAVGASFTVAAHDIAVEVMAFDGVTVFTPDTVPAVLGWITPHPAPQAFAPLYLTSSANAPLVGPFTASPWTRALHVYQADGTACSVNFTGPLGTMTANVPSGSRVPMPGNALRYSMNGGAGGGSIVEEISFA